MRRLGRERIALAEAVADALISEFGVEDLSQSAPPDASRDNS